jgi:hypothetical protein
MQDKPTPPNIFSINRRSQHSADALGKLLIIGHETFNGGGKLKSETLI